MPRFRSDSSKTWRVSLTPTQVAHARDVARIRQRNNLRDRRTPRYGHTGDPFLAHEHGAIGEKAVAVACGLEWDGAIGDLSARDVGALQVRTTTHRQGRLILHPADQDGEAFILAVLGGATAGYYLVELAGWIMARDGKVGENWCDPTGRGRPAFFVPRAALLPMSTVRPTGAAAEEKRAEQKTPRGFGEPPELDPLG